MGNRKPSEWNLFVKKVWLDNKHKPGYKFKDALKDASKLKGKQIKETPSKTKKHLKHKSKSNKEKKRRTRKKRTLKKKGKCGCP